MYLSLGNASGAHLSWVRGKNPRQPKKDPRNMFSFAPKCPVPGEALKDTLQEGREYTTGRDTAEWREGGDSKFCLRHCKSRTSLDTEQRCGGGWRM